MRNQIKNTMAAVILATLGGPLAHADIIVNLPKGTDLSSIEVMHYPLSSLVAAQKYDDLGVVEETVPVVNGRAVIKTDHIGVNVYNFGVKDKFIDRVYAAPEDDILVEIASISPFYSVASGSEIMDGITSLKQELAWLDKKFEEIEASGQEPSKEELAAMGAEINKTYIQFIEENPTSPLVAYALTRVDDEIFDKYYPRMSEGAKASSLYPLAEKRAQQRAAEQERERKLNELQSGNIPAPDFTLENTYGKQVSLSQFRGKWVILDFWGSWCIWCIKGFPELKEAYQKYAGQLEVIGIDCRESKDEWLAGVKKYELPWVNLYCPEGSSLPRDYSVQGYPTKVIIDPEGKIRNVTTGHNPEFFTILESLMSK